MLTSRDLIRVAEHKKYDLKYKDLIRAMRMAGIKFKSREIHGHVIRAYLTPDDVKKLQDVLRIPFNGDEV